MKLTKKLLTGFVAIVAALVLVACDFGAAPVVNKPVFAGVGPVTHQVNTPFDPLAGVTASDEEDGDLTDDIVITANTVNVDFLGVYSVSYSVTDSDGNTTTANRAVTVTWSEVPPLA
ncbi:MAG TPA: immunoglobulin-like domain-containing protein, partial [Acholeplasma sp.]|nr:immunoglobulin-like domain-containing protein [Acholeplasma sp.]